MNRVGRRLRLWNGKGERKDGKGEKGYGDHGRGLG